MLAALPPAPAIPVALEAGGSLASLAPSAAAGGALRLRARCLTAGASAEPGAALGAAGCWLVQAASGGRGAPWAPVLRPRAGPPFGGGACSAFTARACPAFAAGARPCFAAGAAPGAAEAPAGAAPGGASPAAGLLRVEGTWCRACTERQGTDQHPVQQVPHQCTIKGGKPSSQGSTQRLVTSPKGCNNTSQPEHYGACKFVAARLMCTQLSTCRLSGCGARQRATICSDCTQKACAS